MDILETNYLKFLNIVNKNSGGMTSQWCSFDKKLFMMTKIFLKILEVIWRPLIV